MLTRVLQGDLTITELARRYSLTFAGVAKHLEVLVRAQLVTKRKQGREQVVSGNEATVRETTALLQTYEKLWTERFDRLDAFLEQEE